jgi:hypothetical protein
MKPRLIIAWGWVTTVIQGLWLAAMGKCLRFWKDFDQFIREVDGW